MQEPDSYGIRWEATATRPGYGPLLLSLMDALYPIIPGALFLVEGTAQQCESQTPFLLSSVPITPSDVFLHPLPCMCCSYCFVESTAQVCESAKIKQFCLNKNPAPPCTV